MTKANVNIIKWAVCFILPIIVMLVPATEYFTADIRTFLAVTVFLIALLATENVSAPAVALLMPVAYIIIVGAPPASAFGAWTQPIPWMVLGSFILSYGMEKSGLIKRIALRCVILTGGSYVGIIVGMVLAGGIVSLVITDLSAKAIIFSTLALSICKVLKLELGSKASAGIALSVMIATLDPGTLFMHGTTNILVPLSVAQEAGMAHPTWGEYLIHMFVPHLIFIALCVVALLFMFKLDAETKTSLSQSKENLIGELKSLGPISLDEKKLIAVSVLLIAGILTNGSLHNVHIGWIFLLAGVVLLLPGINIVTPPELGKCNIPFVIVVAAFMSMGMVSNFVQFGAFFAELATPFISGSTHHIFGGLFAFGFLINLILTPLAAYSAFTGPVVMIAESLGVNPLPLVYTFSMTMEQIVFPFQFVPVLIIFGYGMISFKDMVVYNIVKTLISLACILTIYIGWWYFIGLI